MEDDLMFTWLGGGIVLPFACTTLWEARFRQMQRQLDNLETAMYLALATRYAELSTLPPRDQIPRLSNHPDT
jgi:hypothetical protein